MASAKKINIINFENQKPISDEYRDNVDGRDIFIYFVWLLTQINLTIKI
jgi:hypothetical protein